MEQRLLPEIERVLARLRRRIRLYVWIEGLAATIVVLGLAFWITLAVDWLLEPSRLIRVLLAAALLATTAAVFSRRLLSRAFVRLANSNLALLLERRFPELDDSLLTSLRLGEDGGPARPLTRALVERTASKAVARIGAARIGKVFRLAPLLRRVVAAVAIAATVGLFAWLATDAFGFWCERMLLSDRLWPRRTRLVVEGFPAGGDGRRVQKVGRGFDFKLLVKADAALPDPPPERVEVRYRGPDGTRGRTAMTRIGRAVPGRDSYQHYQFTFKNVAKPLQIDVVGRDARVRDLRLQVVDRPQIVQMMLRCQYPTYLGRTPRALAVSGSMQIPVGTVVAIEAQANKDLVEVRVQDSAAGAEQTAIPLDKADRRRFAYRLPAIRQDRELLFWLLDADGVRTDVPYRLVLQADHDLPPQVLVRLDGIGSAVTANVRIPVTGQVVDDHRVEKIWFSYRINQGEPVTSAPFPGAEGAAKVAVDRVLDARDLQPADRWTAGAQVELAVRAADAYNLEAEPNVGASQAFLLKVVAADELRSILQRRELLLRRRFETTHAELADTRDLIARIKSGQTAAGSDTAAAAPGTDNDGAEQPAPPAETPIDLEAARNRTQQRLVRALQNVERAGHETNEVATAFDTIRAELVNNRIDTAQQRTRLRAGIAGPIRNISTQMLPALAHQLKDYRTALEQDAGKPNDLREAVAQADAILVEMRQILDRMLELESYNEVVELLRGIIQEQKKLKNRTNKRQQDNLRRLLEE